MTIEQLRNVHRARPFRPFTLHLADGDTLSVRHPDFLSHPPQGRTLIVYGEGDNFSIVDLLLVTRVEMHDQSGAGAESGAA